MPPELWLAVLSGVVGGLLGYTRQRRRLDAIEGAIRSVRDLLQVAATYGAPTEADRYLVARLDQANPLTDELEKQLTRLDDLAAGGRGHLRILLRPYIDSDSSFVAYVLISSLPRAKPVLQVESFDETGEWITAAGSGAEFALGPVTRRQSLPGGTPTTAILAAHRAFIADKLPTLVPLRTTADVVAQLQRIHALIVDWRSTQSPEELLDADLRGLMGPRYGKLSARWKRRLRARLPRAEVRSR